MKVFSGRTGGELASFYAFAPAFAGGATVAAADFTGDGKAELVVGAGPGAGPHVKVFDLATGQPIAGPLGSFYAFDPTMTAGVEVGADLLAGDVTGDGRADLVVGTGPGVGSRMRVFDGVTGAVVSDFSPFGTEMTAGVRVAVAYVSDDGVADVVVGTGAGVPGRVKVFDGATGAELAAPMTGYTPFGAGYTGGLYVGASNDPEVGGEEHEAPEYASGGSGGSGGNSPPVAVGDTVTVGSGTLAAIAVMSNDSDPDLDTIDLHHVRRHALPRHGGGQRERDQLHPERGILRPRQLHVHDRRRARTHRHGHRLR
ncbi:Ig-like domain-containing protein [Gemmata sp. JC717]|uniref:Ig-like domain-containing protein n=1 Tax=Gemmata algarum TaxID=2975278 RepID=UPI0021BB7638|nr:Ig-like domain-containing protein [Gemmata algarum]MDY3557347.1 Ig-like domain-containing protein [Gemmata algarum]